MKYLISIFIIMLVSINSFAQEVGIGVSAQGDRTIYMPIEIDTALRLEPSLYYYKSNDTGEFSGSSEEYEILVGLFNLKRQSEKSKIYYGVRAGYTAYHYKSGSDHEHFEGYKIEPTIGLEYSLIENLTVAGDVSFSYSNRNGEARTREYTSTDSELTVRYYF